MKKTNGQVTEKSTRSDAGSRKLTSRDLRGLRWIGDQYAVQEEVLADVLGRMAGGGVLAKSSVWRVVKRWRDIGAVEVGRVLVEDESSWVWLTEKGRRLVDSPWKCWEPKAARMAHVGAVGVVRAQLEREFPEGRWVSERRLRQLRALDREHRAHVADGVVVDDAGRVMFVEAELSTKGAQRTGDILADLLMRRTPSGRPTSVSYHVSSKAAACVLHQVAVLSKADKRRVRVHDPEGNALSTEVAR